MKNSMRILMFFVICEMLSINAFAAAWSTTSMTIATTTITTTVTANMADINKQVQSILSLYDQEVVSKIASKNDTLLNIEGLESAIMIEIRAIKHNQELLNELQSRE